MNLLSIPGKAAAAIALIGVSGVLAAASNLDLKPGMYESTITYEVQNQRQGRLRTVTRCIGAEDLADPEKIFNDPTEAPPKPQDRCWARDLKTAGGKVSYDADCPNRTVHVEGLLTRTGFTVIRVVKPKTTDGVSLKFTVHASRIRDCQMTGRH